MMKLRFASAAIILLLAAGCSAGGPPQGDGKGGGPELVAGGAIFRYVNRNANKVHLVGDFNQWSPTADPMTDENGDGVWTLFFPLEPGRYQYKFVVDGQLWVPDPRNPSSVSDGFDGRNSVATIPRLSG